jgi:hypothetical protein
MVIDSSTQTHRQCSAERAGRCAGLVAQRRHNGRGLNEWGNVTDIRQSATDADGGAPTDSAASESLMLDDEDGLRVESDLSMAVADDVPEDKGSALGRSNSTTAVRPRRYRQKTS